MQRSAIERLRSVSGGDQGVGLSDSTCAYLVCLAASDLGLLDLLPDAPEIVDPLFSQAHPATLVVDGRDFMADLELLLKHRDDVDSYFLCLGKLQKARLKYQRVLETQPKPNMDQVAPRALLQYGHYSASGLAGLLYWRKWLFDIDNRSAQETGYLFEPIIALSIGGSPASASKSPVRRHKDSKKGRQVDCVIGSDAYEIKLRVTIAASGQGRWSEELEFPLDCKASGYRPVLVVLDATENPKLSALVKAFIAVGGKAYVGDEAWAHLEARAGDTMGRFLERYVRSSIEALIAVADQPLPELRVREEANAVYIAVGSEELAIAREPSSEPDDPELPEDVDDELL
jgi:hypothetical protein